VIEVPAHLRRAAVAAGVVGLVAGTLAACGGEARGSACAFQSPPQQRLEDLRKLKQCSKDRPLTLADVKRFVGPPTGWSGSYRDRAWAYDRGPGDEGFMFEDHCTVTVQSRERRVTNISIASACR